MLLSRFLIRNTVLGCVFRPMRAFCYLSAKEELKLIARIQAENHFADVIKLLDSKRGELNHKILIAFSKRAHKSLSTKEKKNEALALEVTEMLRSLSMEERSIQELTCFLTLLRNMKFSGYRLKEMADTRNLIIAKCIEKVRAIGVDMQNINNLLALYYELAFFKKTVEVKVIAEIIFQIAEGDNKDKDCKFSDKDISFFFHCLTHRVDMSRPEMQIRSLFLKRVGRRMSDLPGEEQARILISFSKTDVIDLSHEDLVVVKQLVQKVEKNISQLGEESIMDLARCSNLTKLPGFFRISKEIYRQIFFEIKKTGITQFGYEKVLFIIGLLSDKIPFHKAHEVQQAKLFSLLEKFAKECGLSSDKSREFCQLVHPLIKNKFFSDSQLDTVLAIMSDNKLYFSTHFLYDVIAQGKIFPAAKDLLLQFKHDQISDQYLVKIGIAVCKSKDKFPQLQQPFRILKERMANELRSPASFIDFFNKLRFRKYGVKLYHFHQCFGNLFNALPNPFKTSLDNPQYSQAYLLYVSQGFTVGQALKVIPDVPSSSLCKVIESEIYSEGLMVHQNSFLVRAIFQKLPSMLQRREAAHVISVITFLQKYNRVVVFGLIEPSTEDRLFKVINILISNLDTLAELRLTNSFFSVIDRYLNRSYKNYRIEHSYRMLVRHLLDCLQLLVKHEAKVLSVIIREGLRLDLINKSICDRLDFESLRLNFIEKERLMYIKDPIHISEITRIEPAALELICSNHNLEETAVEGEKYIVEMIQKTANPIVLCNLLKVYNLRRSPSSKRIHSELLNNLIGKLSGFQGVDMMAVFRNALDKNFFRLKQYRILCEKAIQEYSDNISNYSIYSHIELIKFIMSQKKINTEKYYADLVEFCYQPHMSASTLTLLLRLVGSDYEVTERDAKHVFNVMAKNVHNAVFYFLMVEEKLSEADRSAFVLDLGKKYKEVLGTVIGGRFLISKLQYLYLKKRYPSETAQLNLSQFNNETVSFKLKGNDILSDIEKMSNSKIAELNLLGQNEPIYQIKDFTFYFTNGKKQGFTNEHKFNNRAIAYVFGLKGKIVNVAHSFNSEVYEQMHSSCFGLFSEEEYRKVMAGYSDEGRRAKRNATEEKRIN